MRDAAELHAHDQKRSRLARVRRKRALGAVAGLGAAALALVLAVALTTGGGGTSTASTANPVAHASTGEVNSMGLPVVDTSGSARGTAAVRGIEVDGANWDLGRVPLGVAVRPTWTLRNTGTTSVTLGEPKPEVREGCCPGPLTLDTDTLAPGASTKLTFELAMHPGMDGPHDIGVQVPVQGDGAAEYLTLGVVGDFRN